MLTKASPSPRKAFADRRRDPDAKRRAVLKTAAQLFLEKSYGRTSMNDVADRLNITKPALYHYFDNKEDILVECYRLGAGLIQETLGEIADRGGSGLQKVEAFVRSYAAAMTVRFGGGGKRLDEGDLTKKARAEGRACKKKIDRRLRSFIEEGIADGSIASCDARIAAFSIAGSLNWICMWYERDGPLSPGEIGDQFARILTRGLAARNRRNSHER